MFMPKQDYETAMAGVQETAAYKVEMNAMLFHTVIDGIYADKIASPMREISTNARDGHAAAGKLDLPFQVHLPSEFEPEFWVRDFGCSLSHESVMGLYSTMFASSKRETNNEVGQIGLGSKSPFAYTSVFAVTCWLDNEERSYSCFLGDKGIPQVALVYRRPSNEPDGVKVTMPVKARDIKNFRRAADMVYFGFDPKPEIVNELYDAPVVETVLSGPGWQITKGGPEHRILARQGCVTYPVDTSVLWGDVPEDLLRMTNLMVDFPIGELSVATSREALGYDSQTLANLKARLQKLPGEIATAIQSSVDLHPSYKDACLHYKNVLFGSFGRSLQDVYKAASSHVTYGGIPIKTYLRFEKGKHMFFADFDTRIGSGNPNLSFRGKSDNKNIQIDDLYGYRIYVEKPGCTKATARMRTVLQTSTKGKAIIWYRPNASEDLTETFGGFDYIDLETITPTAAPARVKQPQTVKTLNLRVITGKGTGIERAVYEQVPLVDGLPFIHNTGNHTWGLSSNMCVHKDRVGDYLACMVNDFGLDPEFKIAVLTKMQLEQVRKHCKPVRVGEHFETLIRQTLSTKTLGARNTDYQHLTAVELANRVRKTGVTKIKPVLKTFIETYKDPGNDPNILVPSARAEDLIRDLCPDMQKTPPQTSQVRDDRAAVEAEYPLISEFRYDQTKLAYYLSLEAQAQGL